MQKFDIFGSEVGLIYKDDSLYRTAFGGIVTISFAVLMCLLFFHNFVTLVSKSVVRFTSSTSYSLDPEELQFDKNKFMIAAKIDQANFIQRPTFMISFERRHYYTLKNGTYVQQKEPIFLEPCTIDHFSSLPTSNGQTWEELFETQQIADYLCLGKNQNFTVGGRFQSPDFFHLKFTVTNCTNSTNPLNPWKYTCASQDQIDQKLKDEDNRIQFLFSNYLMKPEQPKDILQVFLDSLTFTIQPVKMYTTANIFLKEQTISTDESILPISDTNESQHIVHQNGDFRQQYSAGQFKKFCEIFFLRSPFSTDTSREFEKIDEVISYIGGFSQIFLLIATFLVNSYNEYVYYFELANKLYDFELKQPIKKRQTIQKESAQQGNNFESQNNYQIQTDRIFSSGRLKPSNNLQDNYQSNIELESFSKDHQKIDANNLQSQRNNNLRISRREDVGLMPLEEIKNIISTRKKTYISQKNNLDKRKSKLNDIPVVTYPIAETANENQSNVNLEDNQMQLNQEYAHTYDNNTKDDPKPLSKRNYSLSQIKKERSPKILFDQPLSTEDRYSPYNGGDEIKNNQNNFSSRVKSEQNLPNFQKNISNKKNITSKQVSEIYQDSQNKDVDSTNSILQGYQKKIFEGLGFNDAQQFLEKELEFIIKRDRSIKITCEYFVNVITCGKFCNTENVKLLEKANALVRQDLDIFNVLDKIKEVDKLKRVLLTEEEQVLFNFFPKKVIKVEEEIQLPSRQQMQQIERVEEQPVKKKLNVNSMKSLNLTLKNINVISRAMNKFKKNLRKNRITEYQTLYECYDKITSQSNSKYNQKLIDLLGDEMNNIFEVTKLMTFKKNELLAENNVTSQKQISLTGFRGQNSFNKGRFSISKAISSDNNLNKNKTNATLNKISHFKQESESKLDDKLSTIQIKNFLNYENANDDDNDNEIGSPMTNQHQKDDNISIEFSSDRQNYDDRENMDQSLSKNKALDRNFEFKNPLQNNQLQKE